MHDIDRTQLDFQQQSGGFQPGHFQMHQFARDTLSEQEEVELAHQLLSVHSEQEFEQFLGDFLSKAVSTVGNIVRSPVGQAIGGVLKGVAQKALPMAGSALGGMIGGPLGAQIGSGIANAAGQALGFETEMYGGSGEQEFEGARQFVRIAADTAQNAVAAAQSGTDPRKAAQSAAMVAARRLAPGLLSSEAPPMGGASSPMGGTGAPPQEPQGQSGQWKRHGRHIVLYGL
jgi:hypothetical protein